MNPIIDQLFLSSLKDSNIAIDTCCLIDSIKYKETVGKFLLHLKEIGAGIYTVPGVVFEFFRGADTGNALENRESILKAITDNYIFPIDKQFTAMTDFMLIMNKVRGKCDLGEYQLIASLVKHKNSFLLTENDKDVPSEFLDRLSIATFNLFGEIKNYGFYKINTDNYEKIAKNILKNNSK